MERAFKYHGLGNDFVVLDRRGSGQDIDAERSVALCDRRLGIGGDGVLVLLPSREASARMVVHNADGSIAEMCGNGLRCAVKYLLDHDPRRPTELKVETGAGVLDCRARYAAGGEVDEVEVEMGLAHWVAPNLPSGQTQTPFLKEPLPEAPQVRGTAVSMGNPHLVLFDVPLDEAPRLGPLLERSALFPQRTNVEFCAPHGAGLKVVVWERGVGLTQACGTGACASVAAAAREGRVPFDAWVPVALPGGVLEIRVEAAQNSVRLRGPATFVFEASVPALP